MTTLRVGIIGGGGRGWAHACGYRNAADKARIVAICDIHRPQAERMAATFGAERAYTDYREMLAKEKLDVVSMTLWPELHAEAVLACVAAKRPPRLINAEKPMAPTWGEAKRMHDACEAAGIRLTFSHQRRFQPGFVLARQRLQQGDIGQLVRIEGYCSNLFDWGTHWFDMFCHFLDQQPIDWVMGQVDCGEDRRVYGATIETSGLSYVRWKNGVTGLLVTGPNTGGGCVIRLTGTKGMIEFTQGEGAFRILREGQPWETPAFTVPKFTGGGDTGTNLHIADSLDALLTGRESILCSRNALQGTELIFATYESARRREKVFLPLQTGDSPLLGMLADGQLAFPDWPAFLTPEEREQGFACLGDSRDLSAWTVGGARSAWSAGGGLLRGDGSKSAWLQSRETFRDLVLRFDFRLGTRSAGTVSLRAAGKPGSGAPGLDVRLFDDRREPLSPDTTGTVAAAVLPTKSTSHGASSWNRMELRLQGSRLTVALNGEVISDRDLAESLGAAAAVRAGRIRFVTHSGWLHLRGLRGLRLE